MTTTTTVLPTATVSVNLAELISLADMLNEVISGPQVLTETEQASAFLSGERYIQEACRIAEDFLLDAGFEPKRFSEETK